MKRRISIHGLVLTAGLGAGCGAAMPSTPTTNVTGEQLTATIEQDLARLRQLQVVEVGQLKLSLPAEATACYGLPCPEWKARYDAERQRQAPRLDQLATIAEAATHNQYLTPHEATEAKAAVQALADLQVVEVDGLLEVQPANNPSCYNLPCESDIEAAKRENARRVTVAFGIAEAAKKAGL